MGSKRLTEDFYTRDVLVVAPELLGKQLVVRISGKETCRFTVTEVEAYRGVEDTACHASKGRTRRTEIMFHRGGRIYMYLIYGIHWMLNIVTSKENDPQAVLIRGLENLNGPGKVTRAIGIDGSFYGEDLSKSGRIWLEEGKKITDLKTAPRIGIDYAGDYWKSKPWRFYID